MTRISKARFEEMVEEATVDCCNDSEKITGWFTMIDDNLAVPFEGTILGMPVVVKSVDLTADDRIIAICARGPHKQWIPLVDFPGPASFLAGESGWSLPAMERRTGMSPNPHAYRHAS